MTTVRTVNVFENHLPPDDDHPYRTGAWRPNVREYDAFDLDVQGELPRDLNGVYLRNTENPLVPAIERYHPFDGDGMLHAMQFEDGKAHYRNRFVRTEGLAAEREAGRPLWAGILETPSQSERDGVGARTRMKDASSTDVVVHRGQALTSFYQCGDLYAQDPVTLEAQGKASWGGAFPTDLGVSAHTKVDEVTGELLFFNYSKREPFMSFGVISADRELVHSTPVPLPGPRLPHDMAFTENYAILNDFPLFWDASLLDKGIHFARMHDLPSRFAVVPRRGSADDIRWFEAAPTYCLHFANAWEEGDEIVMLGYPQQNPAPKKQQGDGPYSMLMRYIDLHTLNTRLHKWRFNLRTGETKEEPLDDWVTEFPTINNRLGGLKNRYVYAVTSKPGWFLFNGLVRYDLETGARQRYDCPEGVFMSEAPMAPRDNATGEDDGYLVTFTIDMNQDRSECHIFEATDISRGPIARIALPERICSGTHATWAPRHALGETPS